MRVEHGLRAAALGVALAVAAGCGVAAELRRLMGLPVDRAAYEGP